MIKLEHVLNLRALVACLVVANVALAGWFSGWFDPIVGIERRTDREPERLLQQVQPQTIRVLPPEVDANKGPASGAESVTPPANPGPPRSGGPVSRPVTRPGFARGQDFAAG